MEIRDLQLDTHNYNNEVSRIKQHIDYYPKVIFDIGANVGAFAKPLAGKFHNAKVHAFEPVGHTHNILCKNVGNETNIIPHLIGFGAEEVKDVPVGMPKIDLAKRKNNWGRATIKDFEGEPVTTIDLCKMSDWCKSNNIFPDLIKLDVEGCEYEILKDAYDNDILPDALYVEINNHYNTRESSQKAKSLLLKDYEIAFDSGPCQDNGEPLNYLFVKRNTND